WAQASGGPPDIGRFASIPNQSARRTDALVACTVEELIKWFTATKQAMNAQLGSTMPGVKETDHQITVRDGTKITVRSYQPETPPSGGSPLAVIFHGGGWCVGGLENEELLCRLICSKLGITALNVDYRLAPAHKFPTCIHDAFDATKWAADNASYLGADTSKGFIIGGTSAGGNLACVISHLWRDEKMQPLLTGTHLMIPALPSHVPEKYKQDYNSWEQNKDAPILSRKACDLFLDNYIEPKDRASPLFSPLLFPTGHAGLPPTYFQICGKDPLRDEALIFERILRQDESIKTKVDVYPGMPHGFWSVALELKASKKFVDDSVKGWEWLLEQQR
ncbi:alpha/beta hydrolase fold, partial [Teratosphaeria destructans]